MSFFLSGKRWYFSMALVCFIVSAFVTDVDLRTRLLATAGLLLAIGLLQGDEDTSSFKNLNEKISDKDSAIGHRVTQIPDSPEVRQIIRSVQQARENLRLTMLDQPISGENNTYNDGFGNGLNYAITIIDTIVDPKLEPISSL